MKATLTLRDVKNDLVELRAMDASQLQDELEKLKKQQFTLRFQAAQGTLEKTREMMAVRRYIARVKMLLREKARATAQD